MSTIKANAILDSAGGNTATINGITPALASQAEAEAGTDNTKLMTPLRARQNVDLTKTTRFGGTIVTNKAGSRATGTTYQNTTGGWLLVSISMTNNGQIFSIGATAGTLFTAARTNSVYGNITYMVPPGWYYSTSGTTLAVWTEGQA